MAVLVLTGLYWADRPLPPAQNYEKVIARILKSVGVAQQEDIHLKQDRINGMAGRSAPHHPGLSEYPIEAL